jgi:neutral zinc metallopeptidase family protein
MYPYFYYDSTMIFLIPSILLTLYAQHKVRSAYERYLRVPTRNGYTGAQTARAILDKNGLRNVEVQLVPGTLTDHYNPGTRILRLSNEVYYGTTVASNAIAAHEVGHAIQHAHHYFPLDFRNKIVPVVNVASNLAWFFIIGGLVISSLNGLLTIGILMFCMAVLFQIITLPVEFDASRRALVELKQEQILSESEIRGGKAVLDAAALTYVAAAASAVSQLLRLMYIQNNRRR